MCMVKALTGAVGGGVNPFTPSPGGAMVAQTGYKATFLGQEVIFADEAQYLKVKYAYEQKIGKGGGGFSESSDEGGMGGNFLGTMGQGLNTVAAFLNGRNLQGKIEDIDDALDTMKATRAQIAAGVAQLVQNFTKGSGGTLGGSNFGTVAAIGVGGLGLASLFSRGNDKRSRR